jgi:hypothetical protein
MRALVLDGFEIPTNLSEEVGRSLACDLSEQGYAVDVLPVTRMRIIPCRACFDCWLKAPGACCYDDDFEIVARAYLRSDLVLIWTPVVFGTYASGMKKVLERLIGLMTPFFRFDGCETHHPPRYDHIPAFFGLGRLIAPVPAWTDVFERLVGRNAANLMSPRHGAAAFMDDAGRQKAFTALHAFLESREGK